MRRNIYLEFSLSLKPGICLNRIFLVFLCLSSSFLFSQNTEYLQKNFCHNLSKVFELGRQDNFDTYDGTLVKQSPFLPVPGYSIKLDQFPVTYVDKDNRFVGKTNLNLDSLSALKKLEELKTYVGFCLDTVQWKKWTEKNGDDSGTVFFKEMKMASAVAKDLSLNITIVIAAPKVYTVLLYIRRRK